MHSPIRRYLYSCLPTLFVTLFGYSNPAPSEFVLITPTAAGGADGGAYFPLQAAFDGSATWDTALSSPVGGGDGVFAPAYSNRVGYIDFGSDYEQAHILETWTLYRTWSGGAHSGFVELWWDADKDSTNDGVTETRLNFNSAFDVPVSDQKIWSRDSVVSTCGGVVPKARYLMLRSEIGHTGRAEEFAMLGYYSPDPFPEGCADEPTIALEISNNVIEENAELMTLIGDVFVADEASPDLDYQIELLDEEENRDFRYLDGKLYSYLSFNYERKSRYLLRFAVTPEGGEASESKLEIRVANLTGKWDENGFADSEVAAKYPSVNEGDFLFLEPTSSSLNQIYATSSIPKVQWPSKILIRGDRYTTINLNLAALDGDDLSKRVTISNFLGQLYANGISLGNGSAWRFTGKYDPIDKTGSKYYPGCYAADGSIDFAFSSGRYGIWSSNEWTNESGIMVKVYGAATGFELDCLEISDGGFAGLMVKEDSGTVDMTDARIHHLYIRDIGSEGIYLGSTQSDPQHMFYRLRIDHCLITRTGGEALQAGQLGADCVLENNVLWGAFDWISPFQRWQDNAVQIGTRQGGVIFRNNIVLGGGEKFYNVSNKGRPDIVPNGRPIIFENNLNWGCRGTMGGYQFSVTDGVTDWEWRNNYWGYFDYDYDRVYTDAAARLGGMVSVATKDISVMSVGNRFDPSRAAHAIQWSGSNATITSENDVAMAIEPPAFRNLLGEAADYPLLLWKRWTTRVGEDQGFPSSGTKKGEPVVYAAGEVVQYHQHGHTRFYRCIQHHSEQEPGEESSEYWELMTWQNGTSLSYLPPDDAQLMTESPYRELGIGLESLSDQQPFQPRWSQILDGDTLKLELEFESEPQTRYQLISSHDLEHWEIAGDEIVGDGSVLTFSNPTSGSRTYFRIRAQR